MFDTPTYEEPPIPDPEGPFADAEIFILFYPL